MEGGAILCNGRGLTVCTTHLLNANRGFGWSDTAIRQELRRVTGASSIFIVETMVGELNCHVDMFMTFTDPDTVVVGEISRRRDPNAELLDRQAERLAKLSVDGNPLEVVRLPMPDNEDKAFRTYTNVVYADGVLLVPSYPNRDGAGDMEDRVRSIYQRLLPDREIVFIDCSTLDHRSGALHCLVSNLGGSPYTPMRRDRPARVPIDP